MIKDMITIIGIQFVLIFIFLIIVYLIIKYLKSYEYEKKFSEFSLLSNGDAEVSISDNINRFFWKSIYKISTIISKSEVIKKHSLKYEGDVLNNKCSFKSGIDYISFKIVIGIICVFLLMFSVLFQYIKVDFMKILIIFLAGYFIPNIFIVYNRKKRKERIDDDLLKAIIIMNNSFKSGRNIMQAIETVKMELEGPIATEFQKISLDMSYGLSLDAVFSRFYERIKTEDAKYIATSLTLLNKTGGNIVKVFSMIEQLYFDKKNLKKELESLTASSVFIFRVLVLLPLVFILIISVLNAGYFNILFTNPIGIILMILILIFYIVYIFIIRRILRVEM